MKFFNYVEPTPPLEGFQANKYMEVPQKYYVWGCMNPLNQKIKEVMRISIRISVYSLVEHAHLVNNTTFQSYEIWIPCPMTWLGISSLSEWLCKSHYDKLKVSYWLVYTDRVIVCTSESYSVTYLHNLACRTTFFPLCTSWTYFPYLYNLGSYSLLRIILVP